MILTLTLNPALDIFYEKGRYKHPLRSAGGKGINVSRVLDNLGEGTAALCCLGGKTGEEIRVLLRREDICHDFIRLKNETRTNVTVVQEDGVVRFVDKGSPFSEAETQKIEKLFVKYLARTSLVVLSGRLPPGIKDSFYARLITQARQQNIPCLLDSHGLPFELGLKAGPEYIKPNREEAEDFLGEKLDSQAKLKKAVRYFLRSGIKNVLITLGEQGAVGGSACLSAGRDEFI